VLADILKRATESIGFLRAMNDHFASVASQLESDRLADAPAGPRNQCDFTFEFHLMLRRSVVDVSFLLLPGLDKQTDFSAGGNLDGQAGMEFFSGTFHARIGRDILDGVFGFRFDRKPFR